MPEARRQAYKLGRVVFSVKNCDPQLEQELDLILPHNDNPDDQVREIDTGCMTDIRAVINYVLKRHYKCLWIDAGCLVSSRGRKVLIAGPSGSGKSTLTMALAFGYGWKVLGEDIVLIDLEARRILSLSTPFSIKPGCGDLLRAAIGFVPPSLVRGEWLPLNEVACNEECDAQLDAAIIIAGWSPALKMHRLDQGEYLRHILPHSNILRRKGSADEVMEMLSNADCRLMRGGTLKERLATIVELGD